MGNDLGLDNVLSACKKGNSKAQKHLYDLFAPKMLVVALRYSKTTHEAEDILQEAFLKAFEKLHSLSDDSKFEPWLKKIVVNTALNQNRSKLYMFPMTDVADLPITDSSEMELGRFRFHEILSMIQKLPTGCQIIFNMFAIEGFSHKEISKKLEISVGTSKSQYSRARMLLKEMIEETETIGYGTYK